MAYSHHQSLKIIERCSISPPPNSVPPTSIPLTFLDLPWFLLPPIQRIFFYELPQRNQILESVVPNLKHSLSLTLQHFFPFAGNIVVPLHKHNNVLPHILYSNGDSVSFTVAETNQDFKSFVDHAPTDLRDINLLVPVFPSSRTTQDGAKLLPVLAVQPIWRPFGPGSTRTGPNKKPTPAPSTTKPAKPKNHPPSNASSSRSKPSTQPTQKKASKSTKPISSSQPIRRRAQFSAANYENPHVSPQKLRLMAKLPPRDWGNL
ncbi:hypothetical protein PIB30_028331 [Stylosanthes scabra]|uniref:Uncharacterized protein n=1 Tax=Stylosanthes scabra TaxID=79078 RepID=A0ABU6ZC41_9FABA|nr:hypothetical protein [Stylosanthes scabra]